MEANPSTNEKTPKHGPSKPPPVLPKPTKRNLLQIQKEKASTPKLLINGKPGKEPEMVMDHTDQMQKTRPENSLPKMDVLKQTTEQEGAFPVESSPFPTHYQSKIPNKKSSDPPNKDAEMLIDQKPDDQSVASLTSLKEQKNMYGDSNNRRDDVAAEEEIKKVPRVQNITSVNGTVPKHCNQTIGEKPPVAPKPNKVNSKLSAGQDGKTSIPNSPTRGPTSPTGKESEIVKDDIEQMSKTASQNHPPTEDVSERTKTQHPPVSPRSASASATSNDAKIFMGDPELLSNGVVSSQVRPTITEEETRNDRQEVAINSTSPPTNSDTEMLIVHNCDQLAVEGNEATTREKPPVAPKPNTVNSKLSAGQDGKGSIPNSPTRGPTSPTGKESEIVKDDIDQMSKTFSRNHPPTEDVSERTKTQHPPVSPRSASATSNNAKIVMGDPELLSNGVVSSRVRPTNTEEETPNDRQEVAINSTSPPTNSDTEMLIVHNCDQLAVEGNEATTGEKPPVAPKPNKVNSKLSGGQDGKRSIPTLPTRGPTSPIGKESEIVKDDIDQMSKTSSRNHPPTEDVSERTKTQHPPVSPRSASAAATSNDPKNVMGDPELLSNGVVSSQVRPTNIEEETRNDRQEVAINSTSPPTNSDTEILIVHHRDQTAILNILTNKQNNETMHKEPDNQPNKLAVGGNGGTDYHAQLQVQSGNESSLEDSRPSTSNFSNIQQSEIAPVSNIPMNDVAEKQSRRYEHVSEEKAANAMKSWQRQQRKFWERYVYWTTTSSIEEETNEDTANVVIFGLHEKSGENMYQKLFPNDVQTKNQATAGITRKPFRHGTIKCKGLINFKVLVSPPQYAVYALPQVVHMVRQRFKNVVRCFVLVFDASFVRFSSDVKHALGNLEKKYYGPTIWNNAVLVILNSDDVIGEGTIHSYLNRQGNENLKYYAEKMGGRVIALPNYPDDYDLSFQIVEFIRIIISLKDDFKPLSTTLWGKIRRFLTKSV